MECPFVKDCLPPSRPHGWVSRPSAGTISGLVVHEAAETIAKRLAQEDVTGAEAPNSRITLDVCTQEVNSNKRAAQSKDDGLKRGHDFSAVGKIESGGSQCTLGGYCAHIALSLRSQTSRKCLGMYGGDDGARTRDLCRDSEPENWNLLKQCVADGPF